MNRKIAVSIVFIIVLMAVIYYLPQKGTYSSPDRGEASILFVGDMMFDRTLRSIAESKGYDFLFSCIGPFLKGFDLVIGNLEGPVTGVPSVSKGTKPGDSGNTAFTFDVGTARVLASNNIRMVNLGNNHILDFGTIGRDITKSELSKAGIGFFGSPGGPLVATTTLHGYKIALVGFNQFLGEKNSQETVEAIWKAKRAADLVAVFTHWGDEYAPVNDYQKALARTFIDAGADLVIGSHPHIIQDAETYNGKKIFYSLGNFIFDQYWSDEVRYGKGVELYIDDGKPLTREVLFEMRRDGTTCLRND